MNLNYFCFLLFFFRYHLFLLIQIKNRYRNKKGGKEKEKIKSMNDFTSVLSGDKPIKVEFDISTNAMLKLAIVIIGTVLITKLLTLATK